MEQSIDLKPEVSVKSDIQNPAKLKIDIIDKAVEPDSMKMIDE